MSSFDKITRDYLPEGILMNTMENRIMTSSVSRLIEAKEKGMLLEARAVVCDSDHNLIVQMPCMRGIIPKSEGAIGITEGTTRDIALISKVNRPVCFVVTNIVRTNDGVLTAVLSRKLAQEACVKNYLSKLKPGDVIPAKVTHMEKFGCFVDVGCGIPSLLPIDAISISRISHPLDRFFVGQSIRAIVKDIENMPEAYSSGGIRMFLSHKELLGTWEENARQFSCFETVAGVIRSVEQYGIFVELTPNLAGLADVKDALRNGLHIRPGQLASVYIKSIIPEKMKIKLIIVDVMEPDPLWLPPAPLKYFTEETHIPQWRYSTPGAAKVNETIFSDQSSLSVCC